ncbi:MAG: metallophosphoesterase family protein [Chloroflexi bacterium]|nr:MAG: metallophosphoesterase family protein [Chloroflexota bacterium]TMD82141.1 MAG: metallophosphoesterase family protein [Chloroflexota bacterium]
MGTWAAFLDSLSPSRWRPRFASCSSTLTNASTPEATPGPTIGLLSDVHSNLEALEAVLQVMPKVDRILVMGDIVGYGPDPNAVIARLQSVRARAVMGNHDQAMLDPSLLDWFNPQAASAARWTQAVLTPQSRRYLAALPKYGRLGRHRYVHGSPRKPYIWEYILDELQALEILMRLGARLCFFGHTHLPRIFTEEGEQVPASGDWIALPPSALVNPGSVGQPRDGNPDAAYAVVDLGAPAVRFGRVPYDLLTTQAKIRQAGLPDVEAVRLALGL